MLIMVNESEIPNIWFKDLRNQDHNSTMSTENNIANSLSIIKGFEFA